MKKHFLPLIVLVSLLFWALFSLIFKVDYWQSHDGDFHLQRAYAAILSLKEGQFPLRWSKVLNYDCGLPLFNFYYPLIYYLFTLLNFLGINLVSSFKLIYILFYLTGTLSFYFFIYHLFKSRLSALAAAITFALNPYYLQLIYVRANPELLTYSLLPLVLLFIAKSKYLPLFVTLILYFLSHNTTLLITFPLVIFYLLYSFFKSKTKNYFLLFTFLLAFLASSFFLGPALFEKKYVKLGTDIAADYQQHFPTLKQLFSSPWGWGYSTSDANDGMSFKLGYLQWLILTLSLTFALRRPKLLYLITPILFCLFLTLSYSSFFWDKFTLLQQLQYPWRLLGLSVFLISLLLPFLFTSIPKKFTLLFFFFILFSSLYTNRNHIRALNQKLLPDFTRIGTTSIADEILPVNAKETCYHDSQHLSYFPYTYQIGEANQNLSYHDCSGYLCLDSGQIYTKNSPWKYQSTPLQKFFNYLSLTSIVAFLLFAFLKRK